MTPNEYQSLAARTECDQTKSVSRMSYIDHKAPFQVEDNLSIRVNHSIIGLAGEVGELAALLQKWIYYGKWDGKDKEELRRLFAEEYGDVLWYVAEGLNALGLSLDEVMQANIRKLQARYPEKYTDYHAEHRDLTAEQHALNIHEMLGKIGDCVISGTRSPAMDAYRDECMDAMKATVVQDGHGFGHVMTKAELEEERTVARLDCEHDWVGIQSIPGSGVRCQKCGKTESR